MKLLMVVDNVHMGLSHDGLTEVAKRFKIDPRKLQPGELLLFLNRSKDKIKVFGPNNVLAYYKTPKGSRLDLNAIQYIPKAFAASGKIDYDTALKKVLEEKLNHSPGKHLSPLEVHRALNA